MATIPEENKDIFDTAIKSLLDLVSARKISPELPEELLQFEEYVHLHAMLSEIRKSLTAFADGNVEYPITQKGYMAGTMKHLQSSLYHLTWQTKRIASGDFSQRIDFMGGFSESFNSMVMQLDETRQQLSQIAYTDQLTGISNRRHFMETLGNEVERAKRYDMPLSFIMFDLDHFKQVNDTYGHSAGDKALQTFAGVFRNSNLRSCDIFGRIGGEEFALALPETTLQDAFGVAERIRATLEKTVISHKDLSFSITTSIGVCEYKKDDTLESLLQRGDLAMYQAKESGRNRVCLENTKAS